MEIEATSADRNLLLEMKGELDHHGARNALRELELSIDAALPKKLVLDLAGVTFMDSSGIALILRAQQRMQLLDGSCWCGTCLSRHGGPGCRRHRPAGDDTIKGGVHTMKTKANNEVTLAFQPQQQRGVRPGSRVLFSPPRWIPPSTSWRTSRPPSARR